MKKKKKLSPEDTEKLFWKTGFNISAIEEIPEEINHVKIREGTVITDDELLFIAKRIKKIGMLDLYYSTISNDGIKHLTQLDSLQELRLKGNTVIDNGCMKFLNEIKSLEFLHVRNTAVNVDGLKDILSLTNLKTVLVSDEDTQENIDIKMKEITAALPNCEFNVNHTTYYPKQPWELLM